MKKRKKLIDWEKTAHKEKIFIAVLFSAIFVLALYIGYDIYDSFETRDETSYLNGAVISLTKEKSQLSLEIDELTNTLDFITEQKEHLDAENTNLSSELTDLQVDYDELEEDYEALQDDLDDCEDSL